MAGTVYLLHFDRPYKHARHYVGNPESSGNLKAVCAFAGRQFRELTGRKRWRSGPFLEFNLVAQRDPVRACRRDLGLQPSAAVVDCAAVHGGQAETAALVEAQRIDVVVGGDEPQAGAPVLGRQLLYRLDERGPRPVPLLAGVHGENLALLPVPFRDIGEHSQQLPVVGLGQQRRILQRVEELSQAGDPGAEVPGEERPGGCPIGGLTRTDLHRITVTAPRLQESRTRLAIAEDCAGMPARIQGSATGTPTPFSCHLTCDKRRLYPARARTNCRQVQHWTRDVKRRLAEHGAGRGARLLAVVQEAGIGWQLARMWPGGPARERQIKAQGGHARQCPLCGVTPRTLPRNRDGSLSRRLTTDTQKLAAGVMTAAQLADHSALRRGLVTGRLALPVQRGPLEADPWATGPAYSPLTADTTGRTP